MPFFSIGSILDFVHIRRARSKAAPPTGKDEDGEKSSTSSLFFTTDVGDGLTLVELKKTSTPPEPEPVDDIPRNWTLWSAPTSLVDDGIWPWTLVVSGNPHLYSRPFPLQREVGVSEVLSVSTDTETSQLHGNGALKAFTAAAHPVSAAWLLWRLRAGDCFVASDLLVAASKLTYNFMIDECAGVVFMELLFLGGAKEVALLAHAACRDRVMLGHIACDQYGSSSVKALVLAAVRVCPDSAEALSVVALALGGQLSQLLEDPWSYSIDVVRFCLGFPEIRDQFLPWKILSQLISLNGTAADFMPEAVGAGFCFA